MIKFQKARLEDEAKFIFALKDSFLISSKDKVSSCINLRLPTSLVKELLNRKRLTSKLKLKIINAIKGRLPPLAITPQEVEREWKEVEKTVLAEFKKIFKIKLKKNIKCYLAASICGAYINSSIVLNATKRQPFNAYVIAEELLHLYYWKFLERKLKWKIRDPWELKGKKWRAWHLSELLPEYILIENENFSQFGWNKINRCHDYPWIPKLRKIADPIWKKSKELGTFLLTLHKICSCLPT